MPDALPSQHDRVLSTLCRDRVPVKVFLVNRIKLQGQVEAFDQHVVLLRGDGVLQMVYRHAISTVVPV